MADIKIYGLLRNATPENTIATADQIKDGVLGKMQGDINQAAYAACTGLAVPFDGMVESGVLEVGSSIGAGGRVVWVKSLKRFAYLDTAGNLNDSWLASTGKPLPELYMLRDAQEDAEIMWTEPHKGKLYTCEGKLYAWSAFVGDLVELSAGGSGAGYYNVTTEQPLKNGYYTIETAAAAMANAGYADEQKRGAIITFETAAGKWAEYRFTGSDLTKFADAASWEEYGGGKIKTLSVNGAAVEPDAAGNADIKIDQIQVDESLDAESTNPVQNSAVTARMNEIASTAVGGVEFIEGEDKTTMNILSPTGSVIASGEFSGGGGSGVSTASRIVLTASLDSSQVKEGGKAMLTYSYDHVDSEGLSDGVNATISITVSRGTTTTYEQVVNNVGGGTYTLDISDYLLAGTVEVRVRATCVTADGTQQTKQAYTSLSVVTLNLTSSYNLASTIAGGGYQNGDTIEIPYTITGSGTKVVSLYLDGNETPTTQTVTRSGTTNGSFTLQASGLSAGRHTVQLVAERDGLLSDSIYIDLLKAGSSAPFVGIKKTNAYGTIQLADHLTPKLTAGQYETLSFDYIAYDPSTTPASVQEWQNGSLVRTLSVPRAQQAYTNRFTTQGDVSVRLVCGATAYEMGITVTESSLDVGEATQSLLFKLSAEGRSNEESDPAQWSDGGVTTSFSGVDWQSSGWIGGALKLINGAKATIGYKPFATDVKSTGLTIEITMRVTNITDRDGAVISCMNGGKGLLITASEASYRTGTQMTYTNEDGEQVTRDVKLSTLYTCDNDEAGATEGTWIKFALTIATTGNDRLMHLFVNGNRAAADIYGSTFSFQQDEPQLLAITSEAADVEIKTIRVYSREITDDEELENSIIDEQTVEAMTERAEENDVLDDYGKVSIDKLLRKGKAVLRIIRAGKLIDVYQTNNKSTDFKADVIFYSPFGEAYNFVLRNCNIRIQGTSSTKYPSKNIRIYFAKGGESLSLTINGVADPYGKNKYKMRENSIPMNLFCMKSDYSDSSMSLNTGGAKLFNECLKELGTDYLTPPQRYQYEQAGNSMSAITVRQAIDGFPVDIFCSDTEDGESEYYGQYNFNNEKSKSGPLFGMEGLDGFTPACPICLETLNNGAKVCLFQSESDEDLDANFDEGLEFNYPEDTYYNAKKATDEGGTVATEAQKTALTRLFSWLRECIADAESTSGKAVDPNDITTFVSQKFRDEVSGYFPVKHLCAYYIWTDYHLSVDQRAKNILIRTWDGLLWYLTYYDGDTQHGKRNDCFLVYDYTTDRDTYDSEASKYAFEGRNSWLWNLVLANLQDTLTTVASELRGVMTNTRVLDMFCEEQSGNWSDRAFNKSGEMKYILPAVGKGWDTNTWSFIHALQGANTAHRKYFLKNRFALLDAKYGTSNFTADNIDLYMNRAAGDAADVVKITANEVYAFGYGTNNSPNIANTGIIHGGETAQLSITGQYTINDPLRIYGASRIQALDMTGAADHLKNGLDLGKCEVLQELNLATSGKGSESWWLVLSSCRQLKHINLNGQAQAKTGSSTSTELDLSNQTRLETLDAGGTGVQSVVLAQGAPITSLHLPSTLTTLQLEYLPNLKESGLTVDGYDSVETFRFAACPGLDWEALLAKCANVRRIRVTGIDMEGDGTLLTQHMEHGGISADGSTTDTCALVGTYRLTNYADEETYDAWVAHYPELNIRQPEYTMIEFDDTVGDDANVSNLDNGTGYKYGTAYKPSGHISKILARRHRALAKVTKMPTSRTETVAGVEVTVNNGDGELTYYPLDDTNSNKYADGSAAKLDGSEGDWMLIDGGCWGKGVNDHLNGKHYSCYCSNGADDKPSSPAATVLTLDDIKAEDGGYRQGWKVQTGKGTLEAAQSTDSSYSMCRVRVAGRRRVRWPSVPGTNFAGSLFVDADGAIVDEVLVETLGCKLEAGMYLVKDVPAGAEWLYFTVLNTAEFDKVVVSDSERIEDMEPDWVWFDGFALGVAGSSVVGSKLRSCATGSGTVGNLPWTDFHRYSQLRGMQQVDAMMHSWIANLFFAKYGRRDSQAQCGAGQHTSSRATGGSASRGMEDTMGYEAAAAIDPGATYALVDNLVPQYAWYKGEDEYGRATIVQVNNTCCLGYEDIYGNKYDMMDCVDLPNDSGNAGKWRIWMADGTTRMVKGTTTSGNWTTAVAHGKWMDVVPVGTLNGSSSTYYCDIYGVSTAAGRVVYRGQSYADASGGVSYAYAHNVASHARSYVGSRLAFRGKIVKAESVAAYKAITEVA